MIPTLSELIANIDIKKLSMNTVIAYIISWGYFFITLPYITKMLGIVRGTTINYLISWGIMMVSIYFLQTVPPMNHSASIF